MNTLMACSKTLILVGTIYGLAKFSPSTAIGRPLTFDFPATAPAHWNPVFPDSEQ